MRYSSGFKNSMVQRMAGTNPVSANALSQEVGVAQGTLSRWLRAASTLGTMSKRKDAVKPKSTRQWTAEEKHRVVVEASSLSEDELGEFLRKKGLHSAQIEEWTALAVAALDTSKPRRRKASPEAKRTKELERELRRKEKALAEVAALLVLKKKAQEIWGDEDDDTAK